MRRVSVASVPSVFRAPARKQEEQVVHCLGQTAKLYARSGFFDDEKLTPRGRRSSSIMPPIPSARSSAMSMKSSSSRESNEYLPIAAQGSKEKSDGMDSGLHVVGETGYLELNSTMRKKSDTKKLPKISKPKNKGKGTKRKKIKEDNDSKMKEIVTEENENRTDISRKGGEGNSVDQASTGEEDADYYGKYGLDPRRQFNMEVSRPFTFSYFPKIYGDKKKDVEKAKNNYKLRKISKTETSNLPN
ncbi:PREDICTED: uncharacterized protein LOC107352476 [Acropora digitifera]|uniref:uncharacterized protein LOC107352476 n=1 Tax=Acropora digitifera TaxID=70779 RepID=UPI00077AEAA4|nr:PREDICTED: uncharacterized protein LOC107352476 [Acropora digitifera]